MTGTIDPLIRKSVETCLMRISDDHPIIEAWLYGSRARGDARPDSDADVAVILSGPKGRAMTVATEMSAAEFDVLLETGVLISAMPIWLEDWCNPVGHSNPHLIEAIKREGVAL